MRALNERLKREKENHDETGEDNWPSIDDDATKTEPGSNDTNIDIENTSSFDPDVEIIDKSEIEEQQ